MTAKSWKSDELSLMIRFYPYHDAVLAEEMPIPSWHQPPALPEKGIRASMLQFLVGEPHPDELAFLPAFLQSYDAIIREYIGYLRPPTLNIHAILGRTARYAFYSEHSDGFTEEEIMRISEKIHQSPRSCPDLEQLELAGTVVDVSKIQSVPPVFERVSILPSRGKSLVILGIQEKPLNQILPALLGRFLHGLGHILIAERVTNDKNEQLAQSWAKTTIQAIRDHSHRDPCTVGQLAGHEVRFSSEVADLTSEQLCQTAIPATFTSELSEQKDFFKLLEETKKMLQ